MLLQGTLSVSGNNITALALIWVEFQFCSNLEMVRASDWYEMLMAF